jgi:histidine triad (HIT) family protein
MATLFSKILSGEIPCHEVWQDADHLAFLDIRPVQPGHTLVIPKREVAYLFDLPQAQYAALWEAARKVEQRLRSVLDCERVVVAVVGWEVRHVHVHLVPTNAIGDFPFPSPKADVTPTDLAALARRLRGE